MCKVLGASGYPYNCRHFWHGEDNFVCGAIEVEVVTPSIPGLSMLCMRYAQIFGVVTKRLSCIAHLNI